MKREEHELGVCFLESLSFFFKWQWIDNESPLVLVNRCPTEEVNINNGLTHEGPLAFFPFQMVVEGLGATIWSAALMELNLDSRWGRGSNGVASSIFQ